MKILVEILDVFLQVFIDFFKMITQIIAELPISQMSLIKALVDDSIKITSIAFIDDVLLSIAGFIPPGIIGVIASIPGVKIHGKTSFILMFLIYGITIFVFQSLLFWIIVGVIVLLLVLSLIFGKKIGFIE